MLSMLSRDFNMAIADLVIDRGSQSLPLPQDSSQSYRGLQRPKSILKSSSSECSIPVSVQQAVQQQQDQKASAADSPSPAAAQQNTALLSPHHERSRSDEPTTAGLQATAGASSSERSSPQGSSPKARHMSHGNDMPGMRALEMLSESLESSLSSSTNRKSLGPRTSSGSNGSSNNGCSYDTRKYSDGQLSLDMSIPPPPSVTSSQQTSCSQLHRTALLNTSPMPIRKMPQAGTNVQQHPGTDLNDLSSAGFSPSSALTVQLPASPIDSSTLNNRSSPPATSPNNTQHSLPKPNSNNLPADQYSLSLNTAASLPIIASSSSKNSFVSANGAANGTAAAAAGSMQSTTTGSSNGSLDSSIGTLDTSYSDQGGLSSSVDLDAVSLVSSSYSNRAITTINEDVVHEHATAAQQQCSPTGQQQQQDDGLVTLRRKKKDGLMKSLIKRNTWHVDSSADQVDMRYVPNDSSAASVGYYPQSKGQQQHPQQQQQLGLYSSSSVSGHGGRMMTMPSKKTTLSHDSRMSELSRSQEILSSSNVSPTKSSGGSNKSLRRAITKRFSTSSQLLDTSPPVGKGEPPHVALLAEQKKLRKAEKSELKERKKEQKRQEKERKKEEKRQRALLKASL